MIPLRTIVRRMSHLAARYTGRGDVHVVDPSVDLRYIFENAGRLRRSLEERRSDVNIAELKEKYEAWWTKYQAYTTATTSGQPKEALAAAKKAMRDEQTGLLAALALPNFVHEVGNQEKPMLKPSKHRDYLTQKGHMRVDKNIGVVHLVGYPVLLQNHLKVQLLEMFQDAILVSPSCFARAAILEGVNVPVKDFVRFTDGSDTFPTTYLAQFLEQKNKWPITVQSAGVSYHAKKDMVDLAYARQRLKHCVLSIAMNDEQMDAFANDCMTKLGALLDEGLMLDVKARKVMGKELRNYETQAIVFEDKGLEKDMVDLAYARQRLKHCVLSIAINDEQMDAFANDCMTKLGALLDEGLMLDVKARKVMGKELRNYETQAIVFEDKGLEISRIGDYISRRLNIVIDNGEFARMTYVETDVDRVLARLIDGLVDGKDVPKSLRDAVRGSDVV
ncbi:hypothetical protein ANCDUO_08516 [Ancylostoma duodenale]|uniref:Uncharacterized protein n=1 Tax=Ancylostoma duodenale TaxID=51022 RepID=A0A0C2CWA8_9BILA|nr:hypothetical protein ANCDUO_08516 [Ancylostoma duodenale]